MSTTQEREGSAQLNNSFTFWVTRLAGLMQEHFNQQLAKYDVTWPQWMLLNVVDCGAAETPAQVAAQIGIDRSAVTRLLDRLEKKGFISREHDGLDRRSVKLKLSPQGQSMMTDINAAADQHQAAFLKDLHSTEQRGLKGGLQKMLQAGGVDTTRTWKHV